MAALPSGVVTFLLTDVEGSTTRWEQQPEAMAAALACHDEVLVPPQSSRVREVGWHRAGEWT